MLNRKESRFEPRRQAPETPDLVFISTTARPTADVYVRPGDASLEQKLRAVYERGADD